MKKKIQSLIALSISYVYTMCMDLLRAIRSLVHTKMLIFVCSSQAKTTTSNSLTLLFQMTQMTQCANVLKSKTKKNTHMHTMTTMIYLKILLIVKIIQSLFSIHLNTKTCTKRQIDTLNSVLYVYIERFHRIFNTATVNILFSLTTFLCASSSLNRTQ